MSKSRPSAARLEAFSDGVIAVIITIMVLELKVPLQNGWTGLETIWPALAVYALSFAFTGVYWINHHHLVHRTEQADELMLYANLLFLFCLSLIPFFTLYVLDKKMDAFSVGLYVVSMILTGFSFLVLRLAIGRHLRETGRLEREDVSAERKHWISLALYLVAVGASIKYPNIALGIVGMVTVLWIVPSAKADPLDHCISAHSTTPHASISLGKIYQD